MIQTRVEIVENILMMILLPTEPCYVEILVWILAYDIRVTSVGKFSLRKDKNGAFLSLGTLTQRIGHFRRVSFEDSKTQVFQKCFRAQRS